MINSTEVSVPLGSSILAGKHTVDLPIIGDLEIEAFMAVNLNLLLFPQEIVENK